MVTRSGASTVNALVRNTTGTGNPCCKPVWSQKLDDRVHIKKDVCWQCHTSWTYQPETGWLPTAALQGGEGK